jgi:cytochrome b561
MRPTPKHGYSSFQIAIHWTVVVLVAFNLLLGQSMEAVFEAQEAGLEVMNLGPAYVHVTIGVSILLIMIARLAARYGRPVRTAGDSPHRTMALLGRINHWAFYGILLLIPVLGALAWFGRIEAAGTLHGLAVWVLLGLIALHVSGVIAHHLMGENLIRRMGRPTGGT